MSTFMSRYDRPSRPRQNVSIRFKLSHDEIAVLDDMMRAGRWPNRTMLIKSLIKHIIEDERRA